jgi:hypothetical protein
MDGCIGYVLHDPKGLLALQSLFSAALAWPTKGTRVWWRYPSARAPATPRANAMQGDVNYCTRSNGGAPLLFSFSMLLFSFLWTGPFHHTALALAPYYQVHLLVCHKKS